MKKPRPKIVVVLLGILGIILIIIGGLTMILTLGSLLLALFGVTDVNLAEKHGSSVDPMSVWGAFLIGAVIGFMILVGGLGIFLQRRTKPPKTSLPELPKF
jgi:uncharacterized membrane protein